MRKGFFGLLILLVVMVVPTHFPKTGGNLQPLQTFAPITQTKGEQK